MSDKQRLHSQNGIVLIVVVLDADAVLLAFFDGDGGIASSLCVIAPIAEELLAVDDEAICIVACHDEHHVASFGRSESALGNHAPIVFGDALRRNTADEEVNFLQMPCSFCFALELFVGEVTGVEASAGCGAEGLGRHFTEHLAVLAHLAKEAVEVLILSHLFDEHNWQLLVELAEAVECLFLLLRMIVETQRRSLEEAEVLGIDHVGVVPLEVLHSMLYAIELAFLAICNSIVGRGECHFDGGALAAIDAAQGDACLEVQAVVGESPLPAPPLGECFAVDFNADGCLLAV